MHLEEQGLIVTCQHCGQRNRVGYARLSQRTRCGQCRNDLPPVTTPLPVPNHQVFQVLVGRSEIPVLTDFWAAWCGPCKMLAPELEKVASRSEGRFLVAKVDTEAVPSLAQQYQISSIPALILFRGGLEVARTAGAQPAAAIEAFVAQNSTRH